MSGPKTRRRRLAIAVTTALAIAAFAFGAVLSDRDNTPSPSAASQLSLRQLAGERLVAGFQGTTVSAALRRMIRRGGLAMAVVLLPFLRLQGRMDFTVLSQLGLFLAGFLFADVYLEMRGEKREERQIFDWAAVALFVTAIGWPRLYCPTLSITFRSTVGGRMAVATANPSLRMPSTMSAI